MSWVFRFSQSRLAARLVALAIANHADDNGDNSWHSVPSLAREAHIHERQVQRCLRTLQKLGELAVEVKAGPKGANIYTLCIGGGKLPPGVVANRTAGGGKSDSAIRKERPRTSKTLNPPTPLFQRGVLTKRDIRMVNKQLRTRSEAWVGLSAWEICVRTDAVCKQLGVDPDVFRDYMQWPRPERPAWADDPTYAD
jgi:hypothetical protein